MIILGVDPGLATVGYGIISSDGFNHSMIDTGVIETPAGLFVDERLEIIYNDLNEIIKQYDPTEISIEELFFNTNSKTAIGVAEARGVILLCARMNHLTIAEYTPIQVKNSVTGNGRAEKIQVQEMVKTILRLKNVPKPDDAADALAAALTHAQTNQILGNNDIK